MSRVHTSLRGLASVQAMDTNLDDLRALNVNLADAIGTRVQAGVTPGELEAIEDDQPLDVMALLAELSALTLTQSKIIEVLLTERETNRS